MIPDNPAHQSSNAELWLFKELRGFPSEYVVLHSLGLTRHEYKRWSEIDFVVIGPEGIFLLEVKGGVVERTGGEWFVTDQNNKKESLGRGPFAQVGGAEAATRRFLRDRLPETGKTTMGYAVVTPDCVLNLAGLDVDRAICFDASNLGSGLKSLLTSLAIHWQNRIPAQSDGLKPATIQKVLDVLCADIPAIPSIRQRVAGAMSEIHAATLEQERLLAGLHFHQRVIVKGPAGSGKSTIAFNECKLRADAGQTVLYLCHTRTFADHLKIEVGNNPNLEVLSADQFPSYVSTHPPVDVLVIDEGQDTLLGVTLDDLELALRGGIADGTWRLLLDPFQLLDDEIESVNQTVFERTATTIQSLDRNVRGTIEVAVTSSALGYVDRIEGGIHGPDVSLKFADSPALWQRVEEVVDEWTSKGVSPDGILVLIPDAMFRQAAYDWDPALRVLQGSLTKRGITLSSPARMKGWESAAVVYAGVRDLESIQARREAYIACTRAQVLLAVIGFESLESQIPAAYAAAVVRAANRNRV